MVAAQYACASGCCDLMPCRPCNCTVMRLIMIHTSDTGCTNGPEQLMLAVAQSPRGML